MNEQDRTTIQKAIDGDTKAISELLGRHGPTVERTLRIGATWQSMIEPADVMQVTYLEAFLRIKTFDLERASSFEAWLRRIAENNLRDAIKGLSRKKQPQPRDRIKPGGYEDSLVGLYEMFSASISTPSQKVGRSELCKVVEAAIDALPERYAKVIRLYDLEGRPIEEVAAELERSTGAVHMLRARAQDRLREILGAPSIFFGTNP
ncbi:MAG: RNA polymerase sigma factor RpoE [Phycisphaerae bacterium]|nr:MAG: RNA polymerase sigma factor RpoE [Phycisphaerae bacterium]